MHDSIWYFNGSVHAIAMRSEEEKQEVLDGYPNKNGKEFLAIKDVFENNLSVVEIEKKYYDRDNPWIWISGTIARRYLDCEVEANEFV